MRIHLSFTYCLAACVALFFVPRADAQWVSTVAGTYDFNASANWTGGVVDGVWDTTLTLAGNQIATFAADTALSGGLTFNYAGAGKTLLLESSSATARTLTLGGDISMASGGNVTIGNATNILNVDLGGEARAFTVASGKTLTFFNALSDGSVTLTGGGTLALASASALPLTVTYGSTLSFLSIPTGANRAASVNLDGGSIAVTGNGTANSVDAITGALTLGAPAATPPTILNTPTLDYVTVTADAAKNAALSLGSISLSAGHAVVDFRGSNLGANTIASQTAGTANIVLGTAPTMIGGGGSAGSTAISIIPWAIGGTTPADWGTSFVTYDAANGIRPLAASEYLNASSVTDGSSTANNVVATTATTFNSATTVNSLLLNASANSTILSGTGTITVTSGAVKVIGNKNVTIASNLNFGSADGYVGASTSGGFVFTITGGISGSGNVTFYGATGNGYIGLQGANTYTGNTVVYDRVLVTSASSTTAIPHGVGFGDVYVYGSLEGQGKNYTINGLNGTGSVGNTVLGNYTLTIGDNNANGSFSGNINNAAGSLALMKIGTGTQVLSGASISSAYSGGTTVNAGVLVASNAAALGVGAATVNSGGKLSLYDAGVIGTLGLTGGNASNTYFTLNSGGILALTLDAAGASDRLTLTGGGRASLLGSIALDGVIAYADSYTLFSGFTTYDTSGLTFSGYDNADYTAVFSNGVLSFAAVPEPSVWAFLAVAGAAGAIVRRRRLPAPVAGVE